MFLMQTSKQAYQKYHVTFLKQANMNPDESIPTFEIPFSLNNTQYLATMMFGKECEYYVLYIRYLDKQTKWKLITNANFENHLIQLLWQIAQWKDSENVGILSEE